MQLTLEIHPMTAIRFDNSTKLEGNSLVVDADELRGLLLKDGSLIAVDFEIASPGEAAAQLRCSTSSNRVPRRRIRVRIFPAFLDHRTRPGSVQPMCSRALQ